MPVEIIPPHRSRSITGKRERAGYQTALSVIMYESDVNCEPD